MNCISPLENRPATGNRSCDSPAAYAQIAQWLQANGITRATVAPDWIPFLVAIWLAMRNGLSAASMMPGMERRAGAGSGHVPRTAQEQNLPLSLTVVGIAPEELSAGLTQTLNA